MKVVVLILDRKSKFWIITISLKDAYHGLAALIRLVVLEYSDSEENWSNDLGIWVILSN